MLWIRTQSGELCNISLARGIIVMKTTFKVRAVFDETNDHYYITDLSSHATIEEAQAALEEIAALLEAKTLKGGA